MVKTWKVERTPSGVFPFTLDNELQLAAQPFIRSASEASDVIDPNLSKPEPWSFSESTTGTTLNWKL